MSSRLRQARVADRTPIRIGNSAAERPSKAIATSRTVQRPAVRATQIGGAETHVTSDITACRTRYDRYEHVWRGVGLAVASPAMGHWGTCPSRLPTISFSVHFRVNLTANLSKYCAVCQSSLRRCQQLAAVSITTTLVTKLLVIKLLLHPSQVSLICPSSQQILATSLCDGIYGVRLWPICCGFES